MALFGLGKRKKKQSRYVAVAEPARLTQWKGRRKENRYGSKGSWWWLCKV